VTTPHTQAQPTAGADVIDAAAGLLPGQRLFEARRYRAPVVMATQASHFAILLQPLPGLSVADRLRVAIHVCQASDADTLALHYLELLKTAPDATQPPSPALDAMKHFAATLTTHPRKGDRAAVDALKNNRLPDETIVALAQLVAFLAYQTRVVAGLQAMQAQLQASAGADSRPLQAPAEGKTAGTPVTAPPTTPIRINGFTNETLDWASWLEPVDLATASELQQQVLDESHPQARTSAYYRTLVHQPAMLRHRSAAYNAIMYAPGGLPRAERELGAMVVSVTNGCVYCTSVHAQRFTQLAKRSDTVEQVFSNPASAGTTARERAIASFAQAVTLRPHALVAGDISALHSVGMGDEDVIDLLHAVAIFGWANRLMHNLGEPVYPA
jgi:uncharacterized peroxidase-related enzyme